MMERVNGKRKALPEEDYISSMPDIIITNILNRLPIDEAVRTSILSTSWRPKWTMLTQLDFGMEFYGLLEEKRNEKNLLRIISRLLIHIKGPITKFVLFVEENCSTLDIEDINNWVVFLCENGIQDLTLTNCGKAPLELSTRILSCPELKHLDLSKCCFRSMSSFLGFPNLLSLHLSNVVSESYTCGEFFTQSPLLEVFRLSLRSTDKIKHAEIATLKRLRVLKLTLCELEDMTTFSIIQLMGGFPQLQDLFLEFRSCKLLADAEKRVPTPLTCLKILKLSGVDFSSAIMVSFAVELICASPCLETLLIWADYEDDVLPPAAAEVDLSRVGQLQLQNVSVFFLSGLVNELNLIKSLLNCSPLLKKMTVSPNSKVFGGEMRLAKRLLTLHRASPIAELEFC